MGITHNLGNSQISGRERENAMARRKREKKGEFFAAFFAPSRLRALCATKSERYTLV
jgi:hypothetical protein